MQVDCMERWFAHVLDPHHHHARDPEEYDVVAGFHHACRIEVVEVVRVVGPAQRRVRPQRRAKPCVQNIFVLSQIAIGAMGAGCRVFQFDNRLIAVVAVPDGDAMPPPQLAADAPVPDVVHPVEIDLGESLRDNLGVTVRHGITRRFRQRLHPDIPLVRNYRLDDDVAPVAMPHRVVVRLDLFQKAFFFQLRDDVLARLCHALPFVWTGVAVQRAVKVHHAYGRQSVALSNLEVRGVMPWRNLQRARAEAKLHRLVANHRQLAPKHRQHRALADTLSVPLIVRVHRNGGIA